MKGSERSYLFYLFFVFYSKKYNVGNALKDLSKKGLALFLIVNLLGVLKPYLGLDLIGPSLVYILFSS